MIYYCLTDLKNMFHWCLKSTTGGMSGARAPSKAEERAWNMVENQGDMSSLDLGRKRRRINTGAHKVEREEGFRRNRWLLS